jgi:hypothetical protein
MIWRIVAALVVIAAPHAALAQKVPPIFQPPDVPMADFPPRSEVQSAPPSEKPPLYDTKVYNPATASYFELKRPGGDFNWYKAQEYAENANYKGVRGRLAVVKAKEIQEFLVNNFRPSIAWIGLKYYCRLNALQWTSGEFWPLTAYANWGTPWNLDGASPTNQGRSHCDAGDFKSFNGVHMWGHEGNFKWNVNGAPKIFYEFFVEYPTGRP